MRQQHRAGEKIFVDFSGKRPHIVDRRRRARRSRSSSSSRRWGRAATPTPRRRRARSCTTGSAPTRGCWSTSAARRRSGCRTSSRAAIDPALPLRARRQPQLPGDGEPLRRGGDPGAARQATGQGQGRVDGAGRPALDPGAAAQPHASSSSPSSTRRSGELLEQLNDRPMQKLGREPARAVGAARPAGAQAAARGALRAWRSGRRAASTSTTTSRSTATSTASRTSSWARRWRRATPPRSSRSTTRAAAWRPTPRRYDHQPSTRAEHMPSSHRAHAEWTPSRLIHWAEKTRPGHGPAGGRDPEEPATSRAGLPRLPRADAPGPALRRRAARGRLRARRAPALLQLSHRQEHPRLGPGPAALRGRDRPTRSPHPPTTTSAAPTTTPRSEEDEC